MIYLWNNMLLYKGRNYNYTHLRWRWIAIENHLSNNDIIFIFSVKEQKYPFTQNRDISRRVFVDWVWKMDENDLEFLRKVILSDETHSDLEGFLNEQNCDIRGSKNTKIIVKQSLHPQRVIVWCSFQAGEIIIPNFFLKMMRE